MKAIVRDQVWQGLGRGFDCNAFVIRGDQQTILVDSGTQMAAEHVVKILSEFDIAAILLTHAHLDHAGGAAQAVQEVDVPIWASPYTAERLETADRGHIDPFFGSTISPIKVARRVRQGDTLNLGNINFNVLETPGHTAGSICLLEPTNQWLFSGDTVFADGSFGRTDLHSGSSTQLIDSLSRLAEFPIDALFPGHMRSVLTNGSGHIAESYQSASQLFS